MFPARFLQKDTGSENIMLAIGKIVTNGDGAVTGTVLLHLSKVKCITWLFKRFFFSYEHLCLWVSIREREVCGVQGGRKKASDPQKPQLKVVVSPPMWMAGTELWSSARGPGPSLQHLVILFYLVGPQYSFCSREDRCLKKQFPESCSLANVSAEAPSLWLISA